MKEQGDRQVVKILRKKKGIPSRIRRSKLKPCLRKLVPETKGANSRDLNSRNQGC